MADLEETIHLEEIVVRTINNAEYRLVLAMDYLRHLIDTRFHFRQDPPDLKQAIKLAQDVLRYASGQSDENRALHFSHMAQRPSSQYGFFGNMDDLQHAIEMMERARQAIPADDLHLVHITLDLKQSLA